MNRGSAALLLVLALASCRTYDYSPHISDAGGLVPGDQFARYGREQAQAVAIARELARVHQGGSPGGSASAVAYARKQPDVTNVVADPLGHRLTVDFKSGWRLGIVPLSD